MSNVSISEENNIGSIASVWLSLFYNISSMNPVTFKAGAAWDIMDFLPEAAGLQEGYKDSVNGKEYSYKLVFGFNFQTKAMFDAFFPYAGISTCIAQVTDNNGLTRILGSLDNPASLEHASDTGMQSSDMNGFTVTLSWMNRRPAIVVV